MPSGDSILAGLPESARRRNAHLFADAVKDERTSRAVEDEMDLHRDLAKHCLDHGYLYIHANPKKKSTIAVGLPDFTVCMPGRKTCFLELKAKGKKATKEQREKIAHARKLGYVAEIADNMPDVLAHLARARALP